MNEVSKRHSADDLYAAFLAGFEEAGEGFNGEYVGEKYRGKDNPLFEARMRRGFDEWLAARS